MQFSVNISFFVSALVSWVAIYTHIFLFFSHMCVQFVIRVHILIFYSYAYNVNSLFLSLCHSFLYSLLSRHRKSKREILLPAIHSIVQRKWLTTTSVVTSSNTIFSCFSPPQHSHSRSSCISFLSRRAYHFFPLLCRINFSEVNSQNLIRSLYTF